ncbi:hypothetical protein HMPREF1550_00052 [Actinomyces sp. oral taxon 877 str. F0543]|nr:hypothetical protein HMPREF1550_00052 [Actinomyces sp. oral taxon 877 str. F0543]
MTPSPVPARAGAGEPQSAAPGRMRSTRPGPTSALMRCGR